MENMSTTFATTDLVNLFAAEMASGVERAVDCWLAQIESVLRDAHLTTLGRLNAISAILDRYKTLTGKSVLESRESSFRI